MTTVAFSAAIAMAAAFVAAGLVLGCVYFAALRWTVELYATGRAGLVPVVLTLTRMAGMIAFLGSAARFGALPLLAGFLGFLAARSRALRAARRTA